MERERANLPDIVLVLGGTNDLGDIDAEEIVTNLTTMYKQTIARGGVAVGVMTIPQLRWGGSKPIAEQDRIQVNSEISAFVRENSADSFLVDIGGELTQLGEHAVLWETDGVHFNAAGYTKVAELVLEAMQQFCGRETSHKRKRDSLHC